MPYSNDTKPSATYTKDAVPTATTFYLLMEDGFRLLQEDGSPIVLAYGVEYSNDTKPSASYTNDALPA
jgi:hypothetical protein